MAKEYILHRNGKEIQVQKEPEVFTEVLPNKKIIEELKGAGIAGLVISANPELTTREVRKIIEQSTNRIVDNEPDSVLNHSKGNYTNNHSEWFGYGKVNTAKAVKKAWDLSANEFEAIPAPPKSKAVKEAFISSQPW